MTPVIGMNKLHLVNILEIDYFILIVKMQIQFSLAPN